MKKIFWILTILILAASCLLVVLGLRQTNIAERRLPNNAQIFKINGNFLSVSVVSTPQAMQQGLSGRLSLTENQGMLFDFKNTLNSTPKFWMKGMLFNLDFVWIKNGAVIGFTENVPMPKMEGTADIYSPPSAVDEVLEVNAGWVKRHGIQIGDRAEFVN